MNIYGSICGHSCLKPKYATKQLYGIYERFVLELFNDFGLKIALDYALSLFDRAVYAQ